MTCSPPPGATGSRDIFIHPETFRQQKTPEQVTTQAAVHFAELADMLRKYGNDPHEIAVFLIRLLFCLFAEDIHLLPEGVFSQLVIKLRQRPQAVHPATQGPL